MCPIPNFIDGYFLPPGEHECTIEEIERTFVYNEYRHKVWTNFKGLLNRLDTLGIFPEKLLINGSFVTGRECPGDVDFGALIFPDKVNEAIQNARNPSDKEAIYILSDSRLENQKAIRILFGAHMLVAHDDYGFQFISDLFRTGGIQFKKLKDPDPLRDPDWVKTPKEKGILLVNFRSP